MGKTIRLDYYGMEGTGRTVTEAKADAGRKIQQALSGSYAPEVIHWRGYAKLIYRDPRYGWVERLMCSPQDGFREGGDCFSGRDWAEVVAGARLDLAQLGWTHADPEGEIPEVLAPCPAKHSAFLSWTRFQRMYRYAQERGYGDNDCRLYAGGMLSLPAEGEAGAA